MKYVIASLMLLLSPVMASASGGDVQLEHVEIDVADKPSLQRGFKLFANYCLSCHSAKFARYSRTATDLGISDLQLQENLIFTGVKVHSVMKVAMPEDASEDWFGKTPPDLSVITRARGADWVYTYLKGFYKDPSRPMGVNNSVFADVGMPHVLWELQGWQEAEKDAHGVVTKLTVVEPGTMDSKEYDAAMRDLVNFMAYVGEPAKIERAAIGPWVLFFFFVFSIVAYMLKKEYWKDIH